MADEKKGKNLSEDKQEATAQPEKKLLKSNFQKYNNFYGLHSKGYASGTTGGLMGNLAEEMRFRELEDSISDLKSLVEQQKLTIENLTSSNFKFQKKIEAQYRKLRDEQGSLVDDVFASLDQSLESWHGKMAYLKEAFDGLQKKEEELFDFYKKFMGTSDVSQREISIEEFNSLTLEQKDECRLDDDGNIYCFEGERTIGRFEEIENVMSEISLDRLRYQERYEELYKEISDLRGGATNEGLGKAYAEAEKKHFASTLIWNFLLLVSVVLLAGVPIGWTEYFKFSFPAWVESYQPYGRIIFFAPFEFPLMFVAYLASKNSNLYRRLAEEYRHKKTLAFTYNGLQAEIGKIKDPAKATLLAGKLLEQSLDASGTNPSALVNEAKSDLPMMKLLELAEKYGEGVVEITKGLRGSKVSIQPREVKSSQNDKAVEEKKETVENNAPA